jgi:hypothetical protein
MSTADSDAYPSQRREQNRRERNRKLPFHKPRLGGGVMPRFVEAERNKREEGRSASLPRPDVALSLARVRDQLLRSENPLNSVRVWLGLRERAPLFEQLARAAPTRTRKGTAARQERSSEPSLQRLF